MNFGIKFDYSFGYTLQSAKYIEDGFYIVVIFDDEINLMEIHLGGEEDCIFTSDSLNAVLDYAKVLRLL